LILNLERNACAGRCGWFRLCRAVYRTTFRGDSGFEHLLVLDAHLLAFFIADSSADAVYPRALAAIVRGLALNLSRSGSRNISILTLCIFLGHLTLRVSATTISRSGKL
jgi:hypothetical protein